MESIGEKIYNLRTEKNLSQEELAKALYVTRFTVSRWEKGTVLPSDENVKYLCEYFKVDLNYFCDNQELSTASNEQAALKESLAEDKVEVTPPKSFLRYSLKVVSIVVGFVLLAIALTACGIAVYIQITPEGGQYIMKSSRADYVGIVLLILGTVFTVILLTLIILLIIRAVKKRKKSKCDMDVT